MAESLGCVIIDDSLFVRETVSRMIKESGHQVIASFEEGQEFLDNSQFLNPDVLFLDIILPNITGLELLEKLNERKTDIKVIMLSGIAQSEAISAALRLGAIDFMQKPVSKERLVGLLNKIADDIEPQSVEDISTIGVASNIITVFLEELAAHTSSTLRHVIEQQASTILEDIQKTSQGMLKIDTFDRTINIDPALWGVHTEETVINVLKQIVVDLQFELQFLYSDEFISNLFVNAINTMSSKRQLAHLFEYLAPEKIGLPELVVPEEGKVTTVPKAASSYDEYSSGISLAALNVTHHGPDVVAKLNEHLLTEVEYMRNSIFFFTLVGQGENFQEGLFGPLPVTSEIKVSSLVYAAKIEDDLILICIYFTDVAERIVSDYNRISFLIKTRITALKSTSDVNKGVLNRILDDLIQYLLE
ncbi:MAG: response regulator [Candidatus Heimdallarchaeota archaeon]|nr:response regulator [Candidatus Heimdallarchaeota archaeon]